MKFNELKQGKLYTDKDGISAYIFNGFYNSNLAEFSVCEYNEEEGCYYSTDEVVLFNKFEVTDLV